MPPPANAPADLWDATLTFTPDGRTLLEANGQEYELHLSLAGWLLAKADGEVYTVRHDGKCSCPDRHFRKRLCKHLVALVAVGLLESPEGITHDRTAV